jgi:HD-GYP domain-containing protein (c-di-GMP phosphodiesterase class II)
MSEKDRKILATANLLHDIGKIGISDAILFKPSRLTAEERLIIETHPLIGEKLVKHLELNPEEKNIILFHHERWDGSGYPHGLGEEEIPFLSRISALADVFDALTSHRPYRLAFPVRKALAEIQLHAGKQFDPHLAPQFIRMITSVSHEALHPAPTPSYISNSRIRASQNSSSPLSW